VLMFTAPITFAPEGSGAFRLTEPIAFGPAGTGELGERATTREGSTAAAAVDPALTVTIRMPPASVIWIAPMTLPPGGSGPRGAGAGTFGGSGGPEGAPGSVGVANYVVASVGAVTTRSYLALKAM
jgi:hypothetical protein